MGFSSAVALALAGMTFLVIDMFVFPLVCPDRIVDAILNFLLVWYYCILTVRESVLISNGSK